MKKLWQKLRIGLNQYCESNRFNSVILGLSGGIDSALTAVLAADTLGGKNVTALMMRTRYTSELSLNIAREIAVLNDLNYHELDIEPLVQAESDFLRQSFAEPLKDIVMENLQARIRGQLQMAWSNQKGGLVLTCGNKSEAYTGYCTLYGDTCGGLAPLGNVYKTTVFALANWRNRQNIVLPQAVIERAPSAELAPDQFDENTLPPYSVLDKVLHMLYDEHKTYTEITAAGYDGALVSRICDLAEKSAFKRRQMAPALEI